MRKTMFFALFALIAAGLGGCSKSGDDNLGKSDADKALYGYWVNTSAVMTDDFVPLAAGDYGYYIWCIDAAQGWNAIAIGQKRDGKWFASKETTYVYIVKDNKIGFSGLNGTTKKSSFSLSGDILTVDDPVVGSVTMKRTQETLFGAPINVIN